MASILQPHEPLSTSDFALAALALALLAIEFTADNQQYAYQSYKHALLAKEKGTKSVEPYDEKIHWLGARLAWTPADARRGFVTRGLWAYSRHPNFFCEQAFWVCFISFYGTQLIAAQWTINLFPLLALPPPSVPHIHPTQLAHAFFNPGLFKPLVVSLFPDILYILPAASLSLLFYSSTIFTESISKSKYPQAYAAYQKRVSMFDPSKTLWKAIVHRLFRSEPERKKIDDLVWGDEQIIKKSQ